MRELSESILATYDTELQRLRATIQTQSETIKGLDRATVRYTELLALKDVAINTFECIVREHEATIKQLQERIATLLEAQASVPTRDTNGTIEAQHGLINKLKVDMVTMDEKLKELGDLLAKAREANKERR